MEAVQIKRALVVAEDRVTALRNESVVQMRRLHAAGVSWAEIARLFEVSPQAAMYATGHARRTPRAGSTSSRQAKA